MPAYPSRKAPAAIEDIRDFLAIEAGRIHLASTVEKPRSDKLLISESWFDIVDRVPCWTYRPSPLEDGGKQ
jgi:hypothetical protein